MILKIILVIYYLVQMTGVFTYAFVEGLKTGNADVNKDGIILVSEIREYVFDKVQLLTTNLQHPTSRRDNLEFDFRVW